MCNESSQDARLSMPKVCDTSAWQARRPTHEVGAGLYGNDCKRGGMEHRMGVQLKDGQWCVAICCNLAAKDRTLSHTAKGKPKRLRLVR